MKQEDKELFEAARNDDLGRARFVINCGADVRARDALQQTPLHLAAANGYADIARMLLKHGADANARDDDQKTPLDRAVESGQTEMVALLEAVAKKPAGHADRVTERRDADEQRQR